MGREDGEGGMSQFSYYIGDKEYISYQKVQNCFKSMGHMFSPLLKPVDEIEEILRNGNYLDIGDSLHSYDTDKEAFLIYRTPTPPGFIESLRLIIAHKLKKLANKIFP